MKSIALVLAGIALAGCSDEPTWETNVAGRWSFEIPTDCAEGARTLTAELRPRIDAEGVEYIDADFGETLTVECVVTADAGSATFDCGDFSADAAGEAVAMMLVDDGTTAVVEIERYLGDTRDCGVIDVQATLLERVR
jgi:hypothetical protein